MQAMELGNKRASRLTWLGHLMRLHPETPARRALEEYLREGKGHEEDQQRALCQNEMQAMELGNKSEKTNMARTSDETAS